MFWGRLHSVRVTRVGVTVYPPGATFGPRRMIDFEFVWIIEGGALVMYDETRIDAPAGTVLLCRPGITDRYDWSNQRKSVHAFFHFDIKPATGWPPQARWPCWRALGPDDILRPLFRYVLRLHAAPEPLRSSLLQPCVEAMLKSFISGSVTLAPEPVAEMPGAVEKALMAIREGIFEQPARRLTLAQLGRAACVSPEHLCRLFRQTLDRGPLEFARLARLGHAAALLSRSSLAIKEIADLNGFSNPYHFSRSFHDVYGLSPRAYRTALRQGKAVPSNPIWQGWLLDFYSRTP